MAMNPSGIRRNLKNIVHNYSDAQVKVREATSNDPWGPSSTLMSEIADLTYNVVAFSEIMQMVWKRLNDHGKNWRHVYKALVLLEYLIKTGTEKVAQQCKENIFAIQTLKDFQYNEENKDQGMNVREKAKQLVALLRDDDRLKNERVRALKAKERFAQVSSGIGSEGVVAHNSYPSDFSSGMFGSASSPQTDSHLSTDLENARPQTAGEEELQLQLALAMSKEEADQEEQKRRSDDVRLQMAITQSQDDFRGVQSPSYGSQHEALGHTSPNRTTNNAEGMNRSALLDFLDMSTPGQPADAVATDPWGMPFQQPSKTVDPWLSVERASSTPPIASDPWEPKMSPSNTTVLGAGFSSTNAVFPPNDKNFNGMSLQNPFDMNNGRANVPPPTFQTAKRTPESFLGENSGLVNLDALVSSKPPELSAEGMTNPFATSTMVNPFQMQQQQPRPSINELRSQQQFGATDMNFSSTAMSASGHVSRPIANNPFLS